MKEKIVISEKKIIEKFFEKTGIASIEPLDFHFFSKKKVIVFTPESHVEKLTSAMSNAGAGNIGKYSMCSFRTEGTGTYMPGANAKPYKGKAKKLSFEKEVKLEMECDAKDINKVLDAVMENHPYEEIVYEVYDFKFRDNKTNGSAITLKSKISSADMFSKINKNIDVSEFKGNTGFKKLAVIENDFDENFVDICKENDVNVILSYRKNKINLIIL
ncbi:MAG TPA: hypothetical protein VK004_06705 [Ignavibacteria bacterium]|nr:hypothetical protein [Ignavibacteria bacterium]